MGPTASGPVSNIAEIEAGGDAVASVASVDASAAINQAVEQKNSAEQEQKAKNAGAIAQGQIAGQPFNNNATQTATSAPAVDPTASGPVSNSGEVEAGGNAVASIASVNAGATINQAIKQKNSAEQEQKAKNAGAIAQGQIAGQPFNNNATQTVTSAPVVGTTTSAPVTNSGEAETGGDAVVSEASVNAGATIGQAVKQKNSAEQEQKAKNAGAIAQDQVAGQPFNNNATQTATSVPSVSTTSAGPVTNTNEVWADGDAVASKASVNAGATIGQTIKQKNSAEQEQKAKNAGAIAQDQVAGQPFNNNATQTATAEPAVGPTTSGPVSNSDGVDAGGDAVASIASVNAGATIGQTVKQKNSAEQEQKAKNAGAIAQDQIAGQPFNNTATQTATSTPAVGPTTSGPVSNSAEVEAGGDAAASKASVNAGATIGQAIKQKNSAEQSQKAKNAGAIAQDQVAGQPFNNTRHAGRDVSADGGPDHVSDGRQQRRGRGRRRCGGEQSERERGRDDRSDDQAGQQRRAKARRRRMPAPSPRTRLLVSRSTITRTQTATSAPALVRPRQVPVTNSGEVEAGGDAVVSKASVNAGATIGQTIKQGNSARQKQKAEGCRRHRAEPDLPNHSTIRPADRDGSADVGPTTQGRSPTAPRSKPAAMRWRAKRA